MLRVSIHAAAEIDAREAWLWYRVRSSVAAEAFEIEVVRAIDAIAEAPERWPERADGIRRYAMRRFPFIVIFRIEVDEVRVLAIQHGRRRPGYWKRRE